MVGLLLPLNELQTQSFRLMQQQVNVATQIQDTMSADVVMIKEALVGDVKGAEGLITRVSRVERFKRYQTWALGVIFAGKHGYG